MEVGGLLQDPAALLPPAPREEPRCSFNMKLGVPQGRSRRFEEENSFLSLPGFEPLPVRFVA